MADPLPNRTQELPDRKYYDPDSTENWADPLEAAIEEVSANAIVSGPNRSDFDPLDGQLYIPSDGGDWYLGTGTAWQNLGPIGDITSHTEDTTNPHSVTSDQVGAPSDAEFGFHTTDQTNPHAVTAQQTGAMPADGTVANTRIVAPSVSSSFDTLQAAINDLPAEGGAIQIAETCTETANISTSKRITLHGVGGGFDRNAAAYVDLNGNDFHLLAGAAGSTLNNVQFDGGGVIIGETGQFGGRHSIRNVTIQNSPNVGVEFRGGHLNGVYDISVWNAGGWGWLFNLNHSVDYFNQNIIYPMSHSCANGIRMVGETGSFSQVHGNDWLRWDIEAIPAGGTGWDVDPTISLRSNKFWGYGIHDGTVDVTPHGDSDDNVCNWYWLTRGDGGTFDFPGQLSVQDTYIDSITFGGRTRYLKANGHIREDHIPATGSGNRSLSEWNVYQSGTEYARVGKLTSANDRFYFQGPSVAEWYFSGADIEMGDAGSGIILTTPDGTAQYKLTIDNTGNVTTTQV